MANKSFLLGINTKALKYCEQDAFLMKECLEKHNFQVHIPENVEKGKLITDFGEWIDTIGDTDRILFYYSGHGLFKDNRLTLILNDFGKSNSYLEISHIVNLIQRKKNNEQLIILDCCHASYALEYLKSYDNMNNVLVATDKRELAKEKDELKASFLTYLIHKGLTEKYAEIADHNGEVRLGNFHSKWLVKETKRYNFENSSQEAIHEPILLFPSSRRDFLFAKIESNEIDTSKITKESSLCSNRLNLDKQVTRYFTGREEQLDKLKKIIIEQQKAKAPRVAVILGTGGVGKSTLAYHFANKYEKSFPHGVIAKQISNKEINEIAREFARCCIEINDLDEEMNATTIMQTVFHTREMLLIFDGADDKLKINDLMPGGNKCTVIVTTRNRELIEDLEINDERVVDLPPFGLPDSVKLLEKILDKKIDNSNLDAAKKIINLVGYLPLALEIVGKALKRKTWRDFDGYATLLEDRIGRLYNSNTTKIEKLSKLKQSKEFKAVKASLEVSLATLEGSVKNFFACLSVCSENGFSFKTAMNAAGLENKLSQADYSIELLYDLSLLNISKDKTDRFIFHSHVRLVAQELAIERDLQEEAAKRHAEFFIEYIKSRELDSSVASFIDEEFDDIVVASKWLQQHKTLSKKEEEDKYEFAISLQPFFEQYGYWKQAVDFMHQFERLAKKNKDWNRVVKFIIQQAKYLSLQGNYTSAENILESIPKTYLAKIKNEKKRQLSEAKRLTTLGGILTRQGQERFDEAVDAFEKAIAIDRQSDNQEGLAIALNSLSGLLRRQKEFDKAENALQRSYVIAKQLENELDMGISLHELGQVQQAQRRLDEAICTLQISHNIFEKLQHQRSLLMIHNSIGMVFKEKGNLDEAIKAVQESVSISENIIGNMKDVAIKLNSLGGLFLEKGNLNEAYDNFQRSVEISKDLDEQLQLGISLNSKGRIMLKQGKQKEAYQAFQHSVCIGEKLGNNKHTALSLINLSEVLLKQKKINKAFSILQRVDDITDNEDRASIMRSLRGMLREQNNLKEIVSIIKTRILKSNTVKRRSLTTILHHIYLLFNEQGLIDETINILELLEKLYKELGEYISLVKVQNNLSNVLQQDECLDEAINALQRSVDVLKEDLDSPSRLSSILEQLGDVLHRRGRLNEAVEKFQASSEIRKDINPREWAVVNSKLAEVYQKQGSLNDAIDLLECCAAIEKDELGNDPRLINTLTKLGNVYQQHKKLGKARDVFRRINAIKKDINAIKKEKADREIEEIRSRIDFKETIGDLKGKFIVFNKLGEIHKQQQNWCEAKKAFKICFGLVSQEDFLEKANVLYKIGQICLKETTEGNFESALSNFKGSKKIAKDIEDVQKKEQHLARIYTAMGQAYKDNRDLDDAVDYLIKGFKIYESCKNREGLEIVTPDLIYILAKRLKRQEEASDYYQRAINIAPTSEFLSNLRESSYRKEKANLLTREGIIKFIRRDENRKFWGYISLFGRSKEIKFEEDYVECSCFSELRDLDRVEVQFIPKEKGKLFAKKIRKINS